jgi:16S rRNA (guanine1207-N2)-methyltransferase
MSEHYYTEQPTVRSRPLEIVDVLRGYSLEMMTDTGVFSREGIDFGSRLLVEKMSIEAADRVLDIGCGYGLLGIVAAKLASHGQVLMVDVNERALQLAAHNVRTNRLTNVQVLKSDLFASVTSGPFHKIISNPPIRAGKNVVHQIFEQAVNYLIPGGQLWVVIQKKQGAPSARKKLESLFREVEVIAKEKGYYILCAST